MIYKTLSFFVMFALFLGLNQSNAQEPDCAVLDGLESAIIAADDALAVCQEETGWQFPPSFYNHIEKAQEYCDHRKNGKMIQKTYNSLQGLDEAISEALSGEDGYWIPVDLVEIWIEPVPPAPDCATAVLVSLQADVQAAMALFE